MSEHKKPHSAVPERAEPRIVSPRARKEEEILATWTEKKIFQKSVDKDAPKGDFVFYDGPPFATGLPHYGHILPSTMKDVIPRYKTMQGYRVRRRWGWDCHGLPVENLVEKELGLKTKKDIIDYGIEKFNAAARSSVMKYADEWRSIIPRLGRFVDMENDYETMSCSYTESVWWAFKSLHDKGLIYEGFKSMHLCPRCETTLSNFEVNQGYKDITDISVYVKFRITSNVDSSSAAPLSSAPSRTFALAWTTTPWTLPGNVALAVNADLVYVYARSGDDVYIVAKDKAEALFKDQPYTVEKEVKGSELVGLSYEPVFTYYSDASTHAGQALKHRDHAWKIYAADYVTLEKGSGIVHIAPAFGEEDLALAQKVELPIVHHVGTNGAFTKDVKDFAGMFVKEKSTPENKDAHQKADIEIIKNLANRPTGSLLFAKEKIIHSYPHCWRCETPLLNYASSSWFVKVTALKDKLVAQNKTVGWVPEEVGEGRFGNWLLGARDWAISRSRFWGAPLPVWKTEDGHEMVVMGSIADLKKHTKARNTYYIIRHGEAENNARNIVNADPSKPFKLTKNGREQAALAAKELTFKLKGKNPDYIITSPFLRTKETAEIVASSFSDGPKPITDARIRELGAGHLDGKPLTEFIEYFGGYQHRFTKAPEGGENYADIKKRMGDFLYDIESKYEGKTIVIVTHDTPAFLLTAAAHGLDREQSLELRGTSAHFMGNAEVKHLDFVPLPHNHEYELDLHRPFIDTVQLTSASGKKLARVLDVFDCWFESGSMPYAEVHYPFSEEGVFKPRAQGFKGLFSRGKGYPADFIAEGLDQTRGWFYSMLVLGVALFGKTPYKNVIVNGLILAEDGQKMSKSKKNYPDPMLIVDKYGVDALRYYLMASPAVKAQDLCFSEKGVDEVAKKHIGRLDNVLSFYEMYAENKPSQRSVPASMHVLDRWILARLRQVIRETTTALDAYELDRAVRPFADFIDDLSTWYLRRSRDRFKSEDTSVRAEAVETLGYVLEETSKLIAPVMPFFAEDIYGRVGSASATRPESVHLAEWPQVVVATTTDLAGMKTMTDVRKLVTLGLEARMQAKVQVRQPLRSLKVKAATALAPEFVELMREELNVKNVEFVADLESDVLLDTTIDDELREEGVVRDIMRSLQDLRKKLGLVVSDMVKLTVETDEKGAAIVTKNKDAVSKVAGIQQVAFAETGEQAEAIIIDGVSYKFKIEKVG